MPERVKARLTYTNQPVSALHNASTYPWGVLAKHAREEVAADITYPLPLASLSAASHCCLAPAATSPQDFVVVKLDIDALPVEEKLIHDLMHRKVRETFSTGFSPPQ